MQGLFHALGAQGPGSWQSGRGWYCRIHALCLSDGKAEQLLQGIMEFLASSVKHSASPCAEGSGVGGARFCLSCKRETRLKHEFNKIKPKSSSSFWQTASFYFCCCLLLLLYCCYLLLAPLTQIQITDRFLQWKYPSQECHSEWRNSWKELKYIVQLTAGLQECLQGVQGECSWNSKHLETTACVWQNNTLRNKALVAFLFICLQRHLKSANNLIWSPWYHLWALPWVKTHFRVETVCVLHREHTTHLIQFDHFGPLEPSDITQSQFVQLLLQ